MRLLQSMKNRFRNDGSLADYVDEAKVKFIHKQQKQELIPAFVVYDQDP